MLFCVAVKLEERGIVGGAFDLRNDAELVGELDGSGTHVVADLCAVAPRREVVADLQDFPTLASVPFDSA